jgi:hypothetical protein
VKDTKILMLLALAGILCVSCTSRYMDEADDLPWNNTAGHRLLDPDLMDEER